MKKSNKQLEMLLKIQKAFESLKETMTYYENISIDDLILELSKHGIILSEQEILDKYQEYFNSKDVDDYFYERDLELWDRLENKKGFLSSDALTWLIRKIIEKNYDVETLCDPYFIMNRIDALDNVSKKQYQEKVLGIIESLVEYAKKRNIYKIEGMLEMYDVNVILKDEIRRCHQRDAHFKKVLQSYYDTFEDADHSIYKIK